MTLTAVYWTVFAATIALILLDCPRAAAPTLIIALLTALALTSAIA